MSASKNQGSKLDNDHDTWVAQTVSNLRRNPSGIDGPIVIQWVVLLIAALDTGEAALDPCELDLWTSAAIASLARLAAATRKRTRDDARWALSQIGLTLDSARAALASEEKLSDVLVGLWAEKLIRLAEQ